MCSGRRYYHSVAKGVPQGLVLGPLLFILHIYNLDQQVSHAKFHFYADDIVMYCAAFTPTEILHQQAFNDAFNANKT